MHRRQFQRRVQNQLPAACPRKSCPYSDPSIKPDGGVWALVDGCQDMLQYITVTGSITVDMPHYKCRGCSFERWIGPAEIGCFPSTPQRTAAFYDEELLKLTDTIRLKSAYSATALAGVLEELHKSNGLQSKCSTLEALSTAALHWANTQELLRSESCAADAAPVDGGNNWSDCPACSRGCVALSGDACLGLRRFAAAASSSMDLQPLVQPSPFLPEADVAERLHAYNPKYQIGEDSASCGNFKAATVTGRKAANYDRMGIAALVCRHGFVVNACSLMTNENFLYYEVLLEEALARVRPKAVFLDVACKFEPYWRSRGATGDGGGNGGRRKPHLRRGAAGERAEVRPTGLVLLLLGWKANPPALTLRASCPFPNQTY